MSANTTINSDSVVQFLPFSFVRSGYYSYNSGGIALRSDNGRYWGSVQIGTTSASGLLFYSVYLLSHNYDYKGFGFTLHCLVR